MKRLIMLLLAGALLASALMGCGKKDADADADASRPAATRTV